MAKAILKIVDRKTTVPREKVRQAFALVADNVVGEGGKVRRTAEKKGTHTPVAKKKVQ